MLLTLLNLYAKVEKLPFLTERGIGFLLNMNVYQLFVIVVVIYLIPIRSVSFGFEAKDHCLWINNSLLHGLERYSLIQLIRGSRV